MKRHLISFAIESTFGHVSLTHLQGMSKLQANVKASVNIEAQRDHLRRNTLRHQLERG